MKGLFSSALAIAAVNANSTPIYGSYPGFLTGEGQQKIQIELFEDYTCSDCFWFNPIFEEVMASDWLDGTVADQVTVGLTAFPLPYHPHSYQVN